MLLQRERRWRRTTVAGRFRLSGFHRHRGGAAGAVSFDIDCQRLACRVRPRDRNHGRQQSVLGFQAAPPSVRKQIKPLARQATLQGGGGFAAAPPRWIAINVPRPWCPGRAFGCGTAALENCGPMERSANSGRWRLPCVMCRGPCSAKTDSGWNWDLAVQPAAGGPLWPQPSPCGRRRKSNRGLLQGIKKHPWFAQG